MGKGKRMFEALWKTAYLILAPFVILYFFASAFFGVMPSWIGFGVAFILFVIWFFLFKGVGEIQRRRDRTYYIEHSV